MLNLNESVIHTWREWHMCRPVYCERTTTLKRTARQKCVCSVHSRIGQDPMLMLMLKILKAWRLFMQSTDITSRSRQFFLKESHLGQNRARCCIQQLRDLNPRVCVSAHEGPLDDDLLLQFQVGSALSRVLHVPESFPVILLQVCPASQGGGPHWLLAGRSEAFWWFLSCTQNPVYCSRHQRTVWVSGECRKSDWIELNKQKTEEPVIYFQSVVLWLWGGVWGLGLGQQGAWNSDCAKHLKGSTTHHNLWFL